MSKSLSASKDVMKTYLSELLTEPEDSDSLLPQVPEKKVLKEEAIQRQVIPKKVITREPVHKEVKDKENHSLEKLLQTVNTPQETVTKKDNIVAKQTVDLADTKETSVTPVLVAKRDIEPPKSVEKTYRQGDFQAMFFDVAGLIIAVPLIELGGIHKVDKTTSLMGKPDWFKGVMLYRDEKINVVDTALWVMPEKCDEKLKNSLNYEYVIMLNDSPWGLLAENLVDTVVLSQEEVKWLESNNKRPWLAGLVKEKMCALLDVGALIQLLDKGSDIYQEQ